MKNFGISVGLTCVLLVMSFGSTATGQESSRDDFREYCQMMQGHWVGECVLMGDWPGVGKKGEKLAAHGECHIIEAGNALLDRWHIGKGSGTLFAFFDEGAKQIKGTDVTSGGDVSHYVMEKKGGKWVSKSAGSLPDGTKTEFVTTANLSDNGDTITFTGSGTIGGKKAGDQHEVWHRVKK